MSVNRLKKIIIKKNVKTENKYIETDESTNKNVISETYNYSINNKNKKKQNSRENQDKKYQNLTENIIEEKKDLNELNKELYFLKNEYESEKVKSVENIKEINNKLDETNKELQSASKENYQLILKLKDIESNLKLDYLKTFNERMKKRNLYLKNEQLLKNRISVKDEEIKIAQKLVKVEKKQQQKYQNLLNEVNNGMEEDKSNDLKKLNEEINKLNIELEVLYKTKILHKYCPKNIQNLKNKLSLYNTEYEFESKKNGMLINQSNQSKNKNTNISEDEDKGVRNLIVNYSQNIRKNILKQNIPKPEKLNNITSRYITEKINFINRTPSNKNLHDDLAKNKNKKTNINLFKENEYNFLKNIIPSKYMNKFVNEFDNIKKEKEDIEKSIEKNNYKKGDNGNIQFKIDYIQVQKKAENKKYVELLLKFRNNEKKKKEIQSKIKIYEKELKKYNKKIDVLDKMQRVFNQYMEEE